MQIKELTCVLKHLQGCLSATLSQVVVKLHCCSALLGFLLFSLFFLDPDLWKVSVICCFLDDFYLTTLHIFVNSSHSLPAFPLLRCKLLVWFTSPAAKTKGHCWVAGLPTADCVFEVMISRSCITLLTGASLLLNFNNSLCDWRWGACVVSFLWEVHYCHMIYSYITGAVTVVGSNYKVKFKWLPLCID